MPFIEKSKAVTEFYFALLVDDAESIRHIAEYIMFNVIVQMESDVDFPNIYVLPLDSEDKFEMNEFGSELNKIEGIDTSKVF